MKIKEIIVVEGKDDTVAIKRAVDADTIETGGSAINDDVLTQIKLAQDTRGVIVFTDPDFPGHKIRNTISEHIPGCKHAFISKDKAKPKRGKGLGVEHASIEDIREALTGLHQEYEQPTGEITTDVLLGYQLIGHTTSKKKREKLGEILKFGYTNGKQLQKRLQMYHISLEQLSDAVAEMNSEEQ
ncbi:MULTISPECIES: ribonuclease M5 [Bacillus]|uniref:ribonuclease M5 n=1 Tax=Bacillus TaxID=1386 RepID=UPI000BB82D5B|nr:MULTISPECIES: ribonuclease M5 [Bacillus]